MIALFVLLVQQPHRPLSVEELAAASPFSGVAVVERIGVRLDPTTGAVYTDAHLRVRETWGEAFPAEVVLTQVGGELDGQRSAAVGWNYALAPGGTIAFFCKPWKGPYFAVTGMRQGLFRVDGHRASWEMDPDGRAFTLAELRARVGRTLEREIAPAPEEAPPDAPAPHGPARPRPPEAPPAGRFFFALAALLGLAAVLVRWARRR